MSQQEGEGPFPWADDAKGKAEEKYWGDDAALKGIKHRNHGRMLKLWGWIVPSLMIVFSLLFMLSLVAWAWHYLTPWSWLKPDQLSKIQSIIFSGSLGALVTGYIQKQLIGDQKPQ